VSGYTAGGTGHGGSEPSKRRAELRDSDGRSITQKRWIILNIDAAGTRGVTQDEAKPDYRRAAIQDSTYTGTRSTAHQEGRIVTLAEERHGQTVYVTPRHVQGRKVVPFTPNQGSRRAAPAPPPREVRSAADRLDRYADRVEPMFIREDVNLADLRTVTKWIKDQ